MATLRAGGESLPLGVPSGGTEGSEHWEAGERQRGGREQAQVPAGTGIPVGGLGGVGRGEAGIGHAFSWA